MMQQKHGTEWTDNAIGYVLDELDQLAMATDDYPTRLSAAELRTELERYLEYRASNENLYRAASRHPYHLAPGTVGADKTHERVPDD
jgi:hypothetical protein